MNRILIIEDEQSIAQTIAHSVEREGLASVWCERGREGMERLRDGDYALVVLDIGLPDISGFELCKSIRSFSSVPVIILTARDEEIDKIVGLEIGADDYVTKPFSPRELTARIKTVLRRSARTDAAAFAGAGQSLSGPTGQAGPAGPADQAAAAMSGASADTGPEIRIAGGLLVIDGARMQAVYHGCRLELTRYEFRLLAMLAASPGRVYSREQIMRRVWGEDSPSLDRTVDAHIKSLRAKCREVAPADPILTHRGTGYALRDDL